MDIVGSSVKLNADCIIHATLEDDKTTLKCLYSYGYRLGPDTDRRINKVTDKSIIWSEKMFLNDFYLLLSLVLIGIIFIHVLGLPEAN